MQKYIVCTFMMALFGCQTFKANYSLESRSSIVKDKNIRIAIKDHLNIEGQITEENLIRLKGIYLEGCYIDSLDGLEKCSNLAILRMYNCKLNSELDFAKLNTLHDLSIRNCSLEAIPDLSGLPELTDLNVDYNKITDVTPVLNLPGLKRLDISDNQIKNLYVNKLAEKLVFIDISNNPILNDDVMKSVEYYKQALPNTYVICDDERRKSIEETKNLLAAHARVAVFATYRRKVVPLSWANPEDHVLPAPPVLDTEIKDSVQTLSHENRLDCLADIAAIQLWYSDLAMRDYPPGGHIDPNYPLVAVLEQKLNKFSDYEFTNSSISQFISERINEFGTSFLLQEVYERHLRLEKYLEERNGMGIPSVFSER